MRVRADDFSTRFFDMVREVKRALQKSGDTPIDIVGFLNISDSEFTPMPSAILKSLEAEASICFYSNLISIGITSTTTL